MTPTGGRQRRRLTATETDLGVVRQRALLVGGGDMGAPGGRGVPGKTEAEVSLAELALLTETAGAEPVEMARQRRSEPDPATYIGKGKAEELAELAEMLDLDLVVFDVELTPAQQRNLEKLFKRDVVDRVALILDIFAQHAHSQAGMLQVELAALRYRLPRLRGKGTQLSRQGAGIGTRFGAGEAKLEVDRRRILSRIAKLERELDAVARARETQRKARRRNEPPLVALVGYTNAGKSTLLNRLTGADVLVEDRLFSTLDATVRKLALPGGENVLLSDTVGFVSNLPHQLVESFRSTLEEVVDADLLLHVIDASSPESARQVAAVRAVLAEIEAAEVPELLVANKVDIASPDLVAELVELGAVPISAVTGEGIDKLKEAVGDRLRALNDVVELSIPYDRGDVVAALHREGQVLVEVHDDSATRVRARLPRRALPRFAQYQVVG